MTNAKKKPKIEKRIHVISKEKMEKLAKLPKKEPPSEVRRMGNKVIYNLEVPGVNDIDDIFINKLESSIEIKAISDDKVYSVEPGDGINITKGALSDLTKIKFTQIKAGDDILLTGSDNETVIEATRIHIISTPEATPTP